MKSDIAQYKMLNDSIFQQQYLLYFINMSQNIDAVGLEKKIISLPGMGLITDQFKNIFLEMLKIYLDGANSILGYPKVTDITYSMNWENDKAIKKEIKNDKILKTIAGGIEIKNNQKPIFYNSNNADLFTLEQQYLYIYENYKNLNQFIMKIYASILSSLNNTSVFINNGNLVNQFISEKIINIEINDEIKKIFNETINIHTQKLIILINLFYSEYNISEFINTENINVELDNENRIVMTINYKSNKKTK